MEHKTVAIGRKYKRDVERYRVVEGLQHPFVDAVIVVLRLDDGDGDIGPVLEDVIGAFRLATGHELAPDDDAPFGEGHLLADLHHPVPACALHCGAYELGADVALAEVFFVHDARCICLAQSCSGRPLCAGIMESIQHWWCWASDTASRRGRVRVGLTATLPQPNTGRVPRDRPERPESDISAASRIRTSDSFRPIHMDEYRIYQGLVGSCSHHGSPRTESRA